MKARLWILASGLVVTAAITSVTALADVSWTGPGWYVEATATGFDSTLISGPYSDKAQCDSALPANTEDYSYDCEYENTDPDAANPPRV